MKKLPDTAKEFPEKVLDNFSEYDMEIYDIDIDTFGGLNNSSVGVYKMLESFGYEVNNHYRIFTLDADQYSKYKSWEEENEGLYMGAIGGGTRFIFEPTGLGEIITIEKEVKARYRRTKTIKLDLTESDNW